MKTLKYGHHRGWAALALTLLLVACRSEAPDTVPADTKPAATAENDSAAAADRRLREDLNSVPPETNADTPSAESRDRSDPAPGDEPETPGNDIADYQDPWAEEGPAELTIPLSDDWKRLSQLHEIWINLKTKQVMVGGKICLNTGPLELFLCPRGTKEHESIVSANVMSSQVHAALLALGVEPGKSASRDPEYRPAYGPEITVQMKWKDDESDTVKSAPATAWIRNFETKEPMTAKWVFGGSIFYTSPQTGNKQYLGDVGELICLSNFETATIDLNVASSQDNANLLYEANPDNIPAVGTQVYAILEPGPVIGQPENTETDEPTESVPPQTDPSKAPPMAEPADGKSAESGNDG